MSLSGAAEQGIRQGFRVMILAEVISKADKDFDGIEHVAYAPDRQAAKKIINNWRLQANDSTQIKPVSLWDLTMRFNGEPIEFEF
ncbi:hypothetical protein ACFLZY_02430 [Patescibacteria group bacterium]